LELSNAISYGLPEIDDRYHIWRVPLRKKGTKTPIGEVVIDARTSLIDASKSSTKEKLEERLLGRESSNPVRQRQKPLGAYKQSNLRNMIGLGDSESLLQDLPSESIDLVFTSPPYYNARPEYTDYVTYEEYLLKLRKIIQQCHRTLNEGRFFVMNVSPVLVRRASRSEASKRIAVPFDMHRIFVEEGFDFIDDIFWVKPEGAGWSLGRGRRFAADRNPLQYKPVPVTEYILVYRKHTDKLIDWNIRSFPDQKAVKESKIANGYEATNLWRLNPSYDRRHPAPFPLQLAERVVSYYSFKTDVVLDPFAGTGTTGAAAAQLGRRFVLLEQSPEYVELIRRDALKWLGKDANSVLTVNCAELAANSLLF
jgi:DNA modification methylase